MMCEPTDTAATGCLLEAEANVSFNLEGVPYLVVRAIAKGEVSRDGGHGTGNPKTWFRGLVRDDVRAVPGKVCIPPLVHVLRDYFQFHLEDLSQWLPNSLTESPWRGWEVMQSD